MSNSKTSSFAETHGFGAAVRMHVTLTRAASRAARQLSIVGARGFLRVQTRTHMLAQSAQACLRALARQKPCVC
jgi:hypothetical protein